MPTFSSVHPKASCGVAKSAWRQPVSFERDRNVLTLPAARFPLRV